MTTRNYSSTRGRGQGAKSRDGGTQKSRQLARNSARVPKAPPSGEEIEIEFDQSAEAQGGDSMQASLRNGVESGKAAMLALTSNVSDELQEGLAGARAGVGKAGARIGSAARSTQANLGRAGRAVVDVARDNPLAVALLGLGGVGLTLLLTQGKGGSSSDSSSESSFTEDESGMETAGKRKRGGRNAGERANGLASKLQSRVGDATSQAGAMVRRVQGSLSELPASATNTLQKTRQSVEMQAQRAEELFVRNPLTTTASALAIGVGIGMMIPTTRLEHAFVGKGRDQLVEKAREYAHTAMDKLEGAAELVTGKPQKSQGRNRASA